MFQRLIARLLHYANSSPPSYRTEFYALKERLLKRYGNVVDYQMQEIRKECWGERAWNDDHGWYDYTGCCKESRCRRCGGTGVFDVKWIQLERWAWCGWTFHIPRGQLYRKPETVPQVVGRIEHKSYGRLSNEAFLWLALLFEPRLFLRSLRSWKCCGTYYYPLSVLQAVAMPLCMRLSRRRCWCGKMFMTWGSGWQICKACRKRDAERDESFISGDVPF